MKWAYRLFDKALRPVRTRVLVALIGRGRLAGGDLSGELGGDATNPSAV